MQYDLIIVGGGLVGAGLAAALRQANLKIALIDARKPGSDDARLFALSNPTCQFLTNIGVWSELTPHAAPIHKVHVSYQKRFGALRLTNEMLNLSELGYVIPAHYIEQAFQNLLPQLENVTLYQPAKLLHIHEAEEVSLTIEMNDTQKTISAPFVIAADGTQSTVRNQLGFETEEKDYEQIAIVTRALLNRPHHNIAYERFTQNEGVIAMLPLIGNECATIWSVPKKMAQELMALSQTDFLQRLQQSFGTRLGKLQQTTTRFSYPLHLVRAKNPLRQNIFLLGNAAHTLHPVAAQGLNLALYEVAVTAETILANQFNQVKISVNDLTMLNKKINAQQNMNINFSHYLAKFSAMPSFLVSLIIPLGLIGLDIATPLKKNLLARLLGKKGRIPLLLGMNES